MKSIETPNLPESRASLVLVDGRVSAKIENTLKGLGIRVLKTGRMPGVYEAVAFHPDIMLHHVGGRFIVHAPGVSAELLDSLAREGFDLVRGEVCLGDRYPANIAYNVARVGRYAIHNTRYTDPVLARELQARGVEFIPVKQGYSKCSVSVVDSESIITSDRGIEKAASKKGIDVLLIEPESCILLPGLDCGFIGGSTGLIGRDIWAAAGSIDTLKSAQRIREFLRGKGIQALSLSDDAILDIGSIIPLQTY